MTFDEWRKNKIIGYQPEIDSEIIMTLDDLKSLYFAGVDAVKKLPHRAMFDEGISVGEIMAAKKCVEIALHTKTQGYMGVSIANAIRGKFGLEI